MLQRAGVRVGHARAFELLAHLAGAGVAAASGAGQALDQRRLVRIHAQAHHVDGLAAPADRDLHPGHEGHAQPAGLGGRFGDAGQLVVVGQRVQPHACRVGAAHHLRGREHPVGDAGMAVQVGIEGDRGDHDRNSRISVATASGRS